MLKFLKLVICTLIFISILPTANGANQLWETKLLWESQESYNDVWSIKTFYNDSLMLYSADGRICIRDVSTGQLVIQSEQYEFGIMGIFINTDVKILAALAYDFNDKDRKITKILRFDLDSLSLIDSLPVDKGGRLSISDYGNDVYPHLNYAVPISKKNLMLAFWSMSYSQDPNDYKTTWKIHFMDINPSNYSTFSDLENSSFDFSDEVAYSNYGGVLTPNDKYYIYTDYFGNLICKTFPAWETAWEEECYSGPSYGGGSITTNSKYVYYHRNYQDGYVADVKTGVQIYQFSETDLHSDTLNLNCFVFLTSDSSKLYYVKYGTTTIPGDMYFDLPTKKMVYRNGTNPNGLIQDYNTNDIPYLTTRINIDNSKSIVAYQLYVPTSSNVNSESLISKSIYLNGDYLIIDKIFNVHNVEIYNNDGKLVKTFNSLEATVNQINLDLNELSQGVYFIKAIDKSGNSSYLKLLKD